MVNISCINFKELKEKLTGKKEEKPKKAQKDAPEKKSEPAKGKVKKEENEVIEKVKEARERISKGQFTSNKDILKEFDLE